MVGLTEPPRRWPYRSNDAPLLPGATMASNPRESVDHHRVTQRLI
jgi:hypothetical protein